MIEHKRCELEEGKSRKVEKNTECNNGDIRKTPLRLCSDDINVWHNLIRLNIVSVHCKRSVALEASCARQRHHCIAWGCMTVCWQAHCTFDDTFQSYTPGLDARLRHVRVIGCHEWRAIYMEEVNNRHTYLPANRHVEVEWCILLMLFTQNTLRQAFGPAAATTHDR